MTIAKKEKLSDNVSNVFFFFSFFDIRYIVYQLSN